MKLILPDYLFWPNEALESEPKLLDSLAQGHDVLDAQFFSVWVSPGQAVLLGIEGGHGNRN